MIPFPKFKRFAYIVLGVALFVIRIRWLDTTDNDSILYSIIGATVLACSVYIWMQLLFPTELREHGVMIYGTLIRWSKVKSYEWQNPESLVLKYKPPLGWQRKQKIKVSPLRQDLIERILQSKLPNFKSYGTSQ